MPLAASKRQPASNISVSHGDIPSLPRKSRVGGCGTRESMGVMEAQTFRFLSCP